MDVAAEHTALLFVLPEVALVLSCWLVAFAWKYLEKTPQAAMLTKAIKALWIGMMLIAPSTLRDWGFDLPKSSFHLFAAHVIWYSLVMIICRIHLSRKLGGVWHMKWAS